MRPQDPLVRDFEAGRIDARGFHHADHIQLMWTYLRACPYEEAERRVREGLQRLATHAGAPAKYHETVTMAWARLVAWAIATSPGAAAFDEFVARHGWLLDKDALLAFYSRERLVSADARARFIEPDIRALPEAGSRGSGMAPHTAISPA